MFKIPTSCLFLGVLLLAAACSDPRSAGVGLAANPAGAAPVVIAAQSVGGLVTASHRAEAVKTDLVDSARVAGSYAIDLPATREHGGFFASLIESKCKGGSMHFSPDGTYRVEKAGKVESNGTWSGAGDLIELLQTHAEGLPEAKTGSAALQGDVLTVKTKRSGMMITLVFQRGS